MDTLDKWFKNEIKKKVSKRNPKQKNNKFVIHDPIKPSNENRSCMSCIYYKVSFMPSKNELATYGCAYDECMKYKPYEHIILNVDEAEGCEYYKEE